MPDIDNHPQISSRIESDGDGEQAPKDKYNSTYFVFYALGTSMILPMCFFFTCNDYWMYRFRDLSLNVNVNNSTVRSVLQARFMSYITMASTIPSSIFLVFNIFYFWKFPATKRIVIAVIIGLSLFSLTTVLVFVSTDSWQIPFLYLSIATVMVLSMSGAMMQAALIGIVVKFPPSYISASISGQSLGGIFAAIAEILSISVDSSPVIRTFLYFLVADVFVLMSTIGFLYIRQSAFFKYYRGKKHGRSIQYSILEEETVNHSPVPEINYKSIFVKIWKEGLTVGICYLVTVSIYPSLAVLVVSENIGVNSSWNDKYFVPVVTYLLYCVCEYTGRVSADFIRRPGRKLLLILSCSRVVFIPALMFCDAQPRHTLPVLFDSDWIYAIIVILLAFSNGYFSTLPFLKIPRYVRDYEREVAGTIMTLWLSVGLSVGSMLSLPIVNLL